MRNYSLATVLSTLLLTGCGGGDGTGGQTTNGVTTGIDEELSTLVEKKNLSGDPSLSKNPRSKNVVLISPYKGV